MSLPPKVGHGYKTRRRTPPMRPVRSRLCCGMKRHFSPRFWAGIFLLSMVACTGCRSSQTATHSSNFISANNQAHRNVSNFNQLKQRTAIDSDPADNALVQQVGRRIAAVADNDMPNAQWEFVVFRNNDANVFCLPHGKVGVDSGILPVTKNETGLAAVLSREIARAVVAMNGKSSSNLTEESQAERLGLIYTARAGYDPKDAIAFWEQFMKSDQP